MKVREQSLLEGREQGNINQARDSIRGSLRPRFPQSLPVSELDRNTDMKILNSLVGRAVTAKTMAEFRRALPASNGSNGH